MTADLELAELAKAGDQDAFAQLVTANQSRIYNLALRMTGNPDDAQELAQEAFLNAWRGLSRFQGDSSFATWLYRLTTNTCIDFLRREKRRKTAVNAVSLDNGEEERSLPLPDDRYGPEQELERRELRRAISLGLRTLTEEHRQVLLMREMDGLSYAEIGAALRLEEGTVKSRIARARAALRKALSACGNFSVPLSSTRTEYAVKGGAENVQL